MESKNPLENEKRPPNPEGAKSNKPGEQHKPSYPVPVKIILIRGSV